MAGRSLICCLILTDAMRLPLVHYHNQVIGTEKHLVTTLSRLPQVHASCSLGEESDPLVALLTRKDASFSIFFNLQFPVVP